MKFNLLEKKYFYSVESTSVAVSACVRFELRGCGGNELELRLGSLLSLPLAPTPFVSAVMYNGIGLTTPRGRYEWLPDYSILLL